MTTTPILLPAFACPTWCDQAHEDVTIDAGGTVAGFHEATIGHVDTAHGRVGVDLGADVGRPAHVGLYGPGDAEQLTPDEARALAGHLIECANRADIVNSATT